MWPPMRSIIASRPAGVIERLTAIDFFPRLERLITTLTGLEPRADDHAFQVSVIASNGDELQ